ncbi:MAG: acetoacetate decarboxylase family protein [Magnetospirillum sp.]|nr:acetoacetate decarboxylase family protein [Magnetospirillum sp.]
MLNGLTPPYTPSGRSSLVAPPPWHYAGQILSLAFPVEAAAAQALLPGGFGTATGRAIGHFCDWQATTEGWELEDPAYAQYREFFVLIEAERAGGLGLYCPFIYVDQDISLARGWLQGWPKKLGSVWVTRSYDLDHVAAAPRRAGTRLGATLAVKDRRLAEAVVTLDGAEGRRLGFLATPTFGLVASPSLIGGAQPGTPVLARAVVEGMVAGPFVGGSATLAFLPSPRDELAQAWPPRPGHGQRRQRGLHHHRRNSGIILPTPSNHVILRRNRRISAWHTVSEPAMPCQDEILCSARDDAGNSKRDGL